MPRRADIWARFERHYAKTFSDAALKYAKSLEETAKESSVTRALYAIRSLVPYIGKAKLIDVDNDLFETFKSDRWLGKGAFSRPAMAGTINKEIGVAQAVINKAAKVWRWIPMAPTIERVNGESRVSYPLSWKEQDSLFEHLPDRWARGAALFAVNTGVRKGELFGLKWSDLVETESGMMLFVLRDTKNGKDRAVICNSLARSAVEEQRENGSDYVFPSSAPTRLGSKVINDHKVWTGAWEKAGLPMDTLVRKGIHNCRHTFGYRLRAAGIPQEDRDALLGHANTNISQHYALPDLVRLTEMAEKVTERREDVILRALSF